MKFRKRPVVVEAYPWGKNGDHPLDRIGEAVPDVLNTVPGATYPRQEGALVRFYRHPDDDGTRVCEHCGVAMHDHGWIDTKEGGHIVCPGDWIITGVAGEHYPCKPDIFAKTYEPADQPARRAMADRGIGSPYPHPIPDTIPQPSPVNAERGPQAPPVQVNPTHPRPSPKE